MKDIEIIPKNEKQDFLHDDFLVLTADLTVPVISGLPKAALKRLNNFYESLLQEKLKYARKVLYPIAVKDYKNAVERGLSPQVYSLSMNYTVTLARLPSEKDTEETFSLYYDVYEYTGGAHGATVRYADNFSAATGYPLPSLIPRKKRGAALREITRQAVAQNASGQIPYFDKLSRNVRKYYRADQYYLTETGASVFYQLYTLAPYTAGVVTFNLQDL